MRMAQHVPCSDHGSRLRIRMRIISVGRLKAFREQLEHSDAEQPLPTWVSRARVVEILNRKRALTLSMIRALSRLPDLPAGALVQAYTVNRVG
jgi:hypothetical protein